MEAWWESLGSALQVFYGIAIATSVLMALQLLLMIVGFDGSDHGDVDSADHGADWHVLSVRTVTAFFTGFGWAGVAALEAGKSLAVAIAWAVVAGGLLMTIVVALVRFLYSLHYSGTLDYRNAVGAFGSVYLPVPGGMKGAGQIEVLVQGRLMVVHAMTRASRPLPNRERVKVVDVVDSQTLLVEPVVEATGAPPS